MSAIFEELITDAEAELTKTAVLLSDCGKTGKKHL
jgi:hypothetical protein